MTKNGVTSRLSPADLKSRLSSARGVQIIDVRTALEFDSEHIENSANIPLDELAQRGGEIKGDLETVLICRSGKRAGRAAELLASYGMDSSVLEGGILDWKKAGLPLQEGKKRLPLERQVQLTIGIILLSSVSAGFLIDRGFFIIPALIGAGLTFAGLTGNCGLALLLAAAPWNKIDPNKTATKSKSSCCS